MESVVLRFVTIMLILAFAVPAHAESFSDFLHAFRPTAIASGVSETVYDLSTAGLTPDPSIKNLVETQPEFTTPIWTYLDQRVSEARITAGKAAIEKNRGLRAATGKRFGVDPYILAAIWGIETNYGSVLH